MKKITFINNSHFNIEDFKSFNDWQIDNIKNEQIENIVQFEGLEQLQIELLLQSSFYQHSLELFKKLQLPTRDLYYEMKSYLKNVAGVAKACILNVRKNQYTNDEDLDLNQFKDIYGKPFSDIKMGELCWDDEQKHVFVAVFKDQDSSQWICAEIDPAQAKGVFNPIFIAFINAAYEIRSQKELSQNLEVLATTDEVTGLYNQRKLAQDLEVAVLEHQKNHDTFSIMFIDVDHFKNVNDNYGHIIGSQLLHDMGVLLKNILRQTDHVYRYGGDEFVVIMPTVKIDIVYDIAARVLTQLKSHDFDIENGEKYNMSISIGIAEYPTDAKSAKDIIRFADEMMYESKKSGRGRVFHVNEVANVDVDSE